MRKWGEPIGDLATVLKTIILFSMVSWERETSKFFETLVRAD